MANKHVTDTNFEQEVLASKVPVLVNFWAPWCTPCRTVAPVVEEVAGHFKGEVKVVKVNTDESPRVARDYKIRSIPTLMIFNSGQHIDRVAGVVHQSTLTNVLEKYLAHISLPMQESPFL